MPRSLYDVPPVVLHPPSPSCSAPPLPASSFSSSPSALPTHGCRSRSVLASCLPLSLSRSAIGMAPAGHATLLLRQQWIPVNSIKIVMMPVFAVMWSALSSGNQTAAELKPWNKSVTCPVSLCLNLINCQYSIWRLLVCEFVDKKCSSKCCDVSFHIYSNNA